MTCEVGSVGFDDVDRFSGLPVSEPGAAAPNLHGAIFFQAMSVRPFKHYVTHIEGKTNGVLRDGQIQPMETGGSVRGEITVSWGDKDGVEVNSGVKAEVHDDRGNFAEIKAEQNSDGTGKVSATAGHQDK